MRSNITFFLLGLLVLSLGCKKKNETVNFHHEYFPMEKGCFVEYQVNEVEYVSSNSTPLTNSYKIKTVIGDTIIDNSGRIARKFYRYKFDNILNEYKIKDVWTAIIDQERAELVEENQRIIKLVFAPTRSKEWDKNAFNAFEKSTAFYSTLHKPYSVNNFDFDSTLVVDEDSTLNFIQYIRKFEVYAKGVGMIKKTDQDFVITNTDYLNPISGYGIVYTLINYGKE